MAKDNGLWRDFRYGSAAFVLGLPTIPLFVHHSGLHNFINSHHLLHHFIICLFLIEVIDFFNSIIH